MAKTGQGGLDVLLLRDELVVILAELLALVGELVGLELKVVGAALAGRQALCQ